MDFCRRPSRLTALQRDLLEAFFAREQRFFLTGGGALAGFYLGHRATEDLDLFSLPGPALEDGIMAMQSAAAACNASSTTVRSFESFKRLLVTRGEQEQCVVDLVIDRAPWLDAEKPRFGAIRVDTLREIAANKLCTLLSRSEIKDLVDLAELLRGGADLERCLQDAQRKDAGAEPAAIAWVLGQVSIGPEALLPGQTDPVSLEAFREELVVRLRAIAFRQASGPAT